MLNIDALNQLKQLKQEIRASKQVFEGVVKGTPGRFGFVVLDDGRECFLSPDEMQKVFPGDRVRVVLSKDEKDRDQAEIEKCLKSELKEFVGRYVEKGTAHFVEPDVDNLSRWLYVPPDKRNGAKAGDLVRCRVQQHPFRGKPQVAVLKVIGQEQDTGIERRYILEKYNLPHAWPEQVLQELASLSEERIAQEVAQRADLRDWPFVTIDSETTQDMDDALYAESLADGWLLHVAIADPVAWLAPGSALEQEALRRGSSQYLPDGVIPMLPPQLANELCSLRPGLDRLALVCSVNIAQSGEIRQFQLREAVIHSKAKLSYHEVAAFLGDISDERALRNAGAELHGLVDRLHEIQQALRRHRAANALLSEDRPDYYLRLNERFKIERIERSETTKAHNLVEECMIAANRCAADFLAERAQTGVFIAHPGFRPDRLEQIRQIAREQLPDFDADSLTDWLGFKAFMQRLETQPSDYPLRAIAVRLLTRSAVVAEPAPHFGMGLPRYTTFTSPIRKFNDLLAHRLIKAQLKQQAITPIEPGQLEQLQETLRRGRQAVSELEQWLKCQYAEELKGQSFAGKIVHANGAGFQVRLDGNGLEGFVNLSDHPEKLTYDPVYLEHRGEKTCFRLEQPVQVSITGIDMKRRQIQMTLLPEG